MPKVLIVDDDPFMINLYKRTFMLESFEVVIAENGEDGCVMAEQEHPDLILMDVMMPILNGLDALKRLKSAKSTRDVPVIMLSNYANQKEANQAVHDGAALYLIKSETEPDEVVAAVNMHMKQ